MICSSCSFIKPSFMCKSAGKCRAILYGFNRNSIRRIPVSIKHFLKLLNNSWIVCSKADTRGYIKVIPSKIACSYVCSNITNCKLSMLYSSKTRICIFRPRSVAIKCRSCFIVTRNHIVSDLNFAKTIIEFWGVTEDVWVEERLEVWIGALNKMCPVWYQ